MTKLAAFAMKVIFGSLEGQQLLKALWSCALEINTMPFAANIGQQMILKSFVDNLDSITVLLFTTPIMAQARITTYGSTWPVVVLAQNPPYSPVPGTPFRHRVL